MTDCVFCRIVSGELPATVVGESADALAVVDITPQAPTHLVVFPRRHVADVTGLSSDPALLHAVVQLATNVAAELRGGWRLVFNTGADAGQTVFHVHAHVLGGGQLGGVA